MIPFPSSATNVAVGVFDGVHRGHQALLKVLGRYGKGFVITFASHPRSLPLLCSLEHRQRLINAFGHMALPVTFESIKDQTAESFLDHLISNGLKHFVLGYDNHIGKGRAGTPAFIKDYLTTRGVRVDEVPPVLEEGLPISSGRVRKLIESGDLKGASHLLGRPWSLLSNTPHRFSLEGLVSPPLGDYPALLKTKEGTQEGIAHIFPSYVAFESSSSLLTPTPNNELVFL